jgi:uncharacterized membrane protein YhaH (DUF805 family)
MSIVACRGCGKEIYETAPRCPHCGAIPKKTLQKDHSGGSSFNWYIEVVKKYATFSGRARRKEYWYFTLFNFIIYMMFVILGLIIGVGEVLPLIYSLAVLIPSIAVAVRRLHDTGRSGWWIFLPIISIIFMFLDSQHESNRFGVNPKTI